MLVTEVTIFWNVPWKWSRIMCALCFYHWPLLGLKYDLSLMSYFIIAVLVCFIIWILINTSNKAVYTCTRMFSFMCDNRLYPRLMAWHSLAWSTHIILPPMLVSSLFRVVFIIWRFWHIQWSFRREFVSKQFVCHAPLCLQCGTVDLYVFIGEYII